MSANKQTLKLVWTEQDGYYFAPFVSVANYDNSSSFEWELNIEDSLVSWGSRATLEEAQIAAEEAVLRVYNDLSKNLAAVSASVRERALRDACKAICSLCAEGREVERAGGLWVHKGEPGKARAYCEADEIQEMIEREKEGGAG